MKNLKSNFLYNVHCKLLFSMLTITSAFGFYPTTQSRDLASGGQCNIDI